MLERLDQYDWKAHTGEVPQAPRLPRLLRRYLTGDPTKSRRASHAVWFVLAGDGGYIDSPGLVALTAVALVEAVPELDAEGRHRAARLIHHTVHEMWLNIYGQPDQQVVRELRERLPQVRALLNEEVPDTVGTAARLLGRLGVRDEEAARR